MSQETPGASPPEEVFWRSRLWWGRAGHTALGAWAASAMAVLATLIAARALGPEEYGSVILALSAVMLVATVLDINFTEAAIFYGNRALATGDHAKVRALLRILLKVDIGIGIVITGALVAASTPVADLVSAGRLDPTLVQIMAFLVLATTADSTTHAALGLARRTDLRARGMAAQAAFRLIGVLVAIQVGGAEAVAISYVLGSAAGSVVLGLLAWRVSRPWWNTGTRPVAPPATTWELVRFAIHSSLTLTVHGIYGQLVPVLLGRIAGVAEVGIFRIAMLPVLLANMASGPIRLAMFPEQAKLFADGLVDEVRQSTKAYTLIAFGLGSLGAGLAFILMPWVIPLLYSSSFDASVTPARILLIAALFNFALMWRKTLLAAIGRPEIRTRLALIELVVVVSVLAPLASMGADGAAIAVSASSVASGVAWLFLARGLLTRESLLKARGRHSGPVPEVPPPVAVAQETAPEEDPAHAWR